MKFSVRAVVVAVLAAGLVPLAVPGAPALAAPGTATAQQQNPLGLSQTQIKKLEAIRTRAQSEALAVQKGKGTDAEKQKKIVAIAKRADAQAAAVLTPAQRKKVEQAQASKSAMMRKMQANNEAVKKTLTPAQKKRMDDIRAAFQKKMAALENDKSLSPQQKQQKAQALFVETDKQVKAVLTAKQKAMLQQ